VGFKLKAILHTKYCPPEALRFEEVNKPVPKADEVLIRIQATTVTSPDCNIRHFTFVPKLFLLPTRMSLGFNKPKNRILGLDVAGEVEAVGTRGNSKLKIRNWKCGIVKRARRPGRK